MFYTALKNLAFVPVLLSQTSSGEFFGEIVRDIINLRLRKYTYGWYNDRSEFKSWNQIKWALQLEPIILFHSYKWQVLFKLSFFFPPYIISQKKHHKQEGVQQPEPQENDLRRSSRVRKEPKNDDYFMGTYYIEELLGNGQHEEDYYPKRRRKNNRFEDSEDYSEGHKHSKKSKQPNANKVQRLLEWKLQLFINPITVNYLSEQQPITPVEDLHKVKFTKHLATQNLPVIAQDVEAIFINIDWGKKGQTIKDFQQLKLQSNKLMSKGLVFVWAPKELISDLLLVMEKKDFVYVQNLEIINLDFQKAKELAYGPQMTKNTKSETEQEQNIWPVVKIIGHVNPADLIVGEPSQFFNRSKRTLLMFKKNNSLRFELRHQRTCDVVFDMPLRLGEKCDQNLKSYIYLMIETLLPDCLVINQKKKNEFGYKMLQLWADKNQYRRGWISVVEE